MTPTSIQEELYAIEAAMTRPIDVESDGQLIGDLCLALDKVGYAFRRRRPGDDGDVEDTGDLGEPSETLDGMAAILDELAREEEDDLARPEADGP